MRALMIDDEEYVRSYLISLFPWSEFGFETPLEAENGVQAISIIQSEHPNVIMTDIKMPQKDGLELTAWVRENVPDIPVIILSAYNDFSYAREALRLGAIDYLIKAEASMEKTRDLLERITGILKRRELEKLRQNEIYTSIEHYRNQALASFWRDVLTGNIDEDELSSQESELNVSIKENFYVLLMAHIKEWHLPFDWDNFFRKSLQNYIPKECEWWLVRFLQGNWVVLVTKPMNWTKAMMIHLIEDTALNIAQSADERLITCNAPDCYPGSELSYAFHLAQETNMLRLYKVESNYIRYQQLLAIQQTSLPVVPDILANWERILRAKDTHKIEPFLGELFNRTIPGSLLPSKARMLVLDLIAILCKVALERRIRWDQIGEENVEPMETLEKFESCDDWYQWLSKLVERYLFLVEKQSESNATSFVIQKSLDFIQTNLEHDISLGDVAEYVGISKCHLSRIFPEYVGEHFSDYVQRLKLEKAKELLRFTNMRIYQVAETIGFYNIRYFSRIFRDIVGVTPADYRRMNR